jgi:hypothetical protein
MSGRDGYVKKSNRRAHTLIVTHRPAGTDLSEPERGIRTPFSPFRVENVYLQGWG